MAFVAIKIGRRQESGTGVSPVYSVSREWDGRLARLFRFKSDGRDARPTLPIFVATLRAMLFSRTGHWVRMIH